MGKASLTRIYVAKHFLGKKDQVTQVLVLDKLTKFKGALITHIIDGLKNNQELL